MFGQTKNVAPLVEASNFESNPDALKNGFITKSNKNKNSTSDYIQESDRFNTDYNYSSDQMKNSEFENNENELMLNSNKHSAISKIDQFLDDCDVYANLGGKPSSRHQGTKELIPNLIAQ